MKSHLSKLGLGLCAASMFLCSSAFAYRDIDDRLDTLEKSMKEISARNPQGTLGAEFRTSRPENEGTPWYLTFDVIYWHPKMGGTEYAITVSPKGNVSLEPFFPATVTTDYRPEGKVKANDFSWDVGLKAGLGYKSPHDHWDIYARYTWFESHSSSNVSKQAPSELIALKLPITSSLPFNILNVGTRTISIYPDSAKSTVDIDFQNIDLELSRSYFTSKHISIKPFLALKGSLIDLSQKITYVENTNSTFSGLITELDSPEIKVNLSSNFKGLGPRIGMDMKYFIGEQFNLFADCSLAILYGQIKEREKDFIPRLKIAYEGLSPEEQQQLETIINLVINSPSRNLSSKFHTFIPNANMFLGLEWNRYINKNKQHLGLKMGYEVQYYWRVNQMSDTENVFNSSIFNVTETTFDTVALRGRHAKEREGEDLMFYGITGEVRLDF